MKLNSLALALVLAASSAVTGCKAKSDSPAQADTTRGAVAEKAAEVVAPLDDPEKAPLDETSTSPGVEKDRVAIRFFAPLAPPTARFEVRGRAPSERHVWSEGYYHWNGREHVWIGGRWILGRPQHEYRAPRWVQVRERWEYIPGHWVRR